MTEPLVVVKVREITLPTPIFIDEPSKIEMAMGSLGVEAEL